MKSFFRVLFLFLVILSVFSGCKEETKEEVFIPPEPEKPIVVMEVSVSPFYSWKPFSVNVGEISERLKSNDATVLKSISEDFKQIKNEAPIETLYILAIRLYDLGEKDLATYWFYTAQMRASVFIGMLESPDMGYGRSYKAAFNSFSKDAGKYINGHAFGDIPKARDIMIQVIVESGDMKPFNQLYPKVTFKNDAYFGKVLKSEANNLRGLIQHTIKNEAKIKADYEKEQFDKKY